MSINYPDPYPTDTFCNWYFGLEDEMGTESGYKLTFIEFDIGEDCDEDYFYVSYALLSRSAN